MENACNLKRRKISTFLKFLIHTNAAPKEYFIPLHPSQISRYRNNFDFSEYIGSELHAVANEVVEAIKQINKYKTEKKIVYGLLRLSSFIRNTFSQVDRFHKTLHQQKDKIVELVQNLQQYISLEKCARYLGLSVATLRNWITSVRVRCSGSMVNLCRKVHSSQLLSSEVTTMKKLLTEETFRYWPLISIYHYAVRNNIVSMSVSTWYKYTALLNIKRLKPLSLRHYGESVRASIPNEYWHADVMQFRTGDGTLQYIYLVVDNFSRMILSWAVSTKLSAAIRTQTFREALKTAMHYHPDLQAINLIVDGGSENNNTTVEEFVASIDHIEIRKFKALKDVHFSNAIAEANNKTVKCSYLNHQEIYNTSSLNKRMEENVYDLTFNRPHGAIEGLVPMERYTGKIVDKNQKRVQLRAARKERISKNKYYECGTCSF